jgi:P27 family predicted phage terminase small subunit
VKATRPPAAPKHLRAATRRWWCEVVRRWELDSHHTRLLTLAAEAWDRCAQARELLEREGLTTTTGAGGAKLHPAARLEVDSRLAFARLLRELDLDLDAPPADVRRPPALRSIAGGRS